MMTFIKVFIISMIVFLLIDLLWLGVFAKKLYNKELGLLLKDKFNILPALIFYIIFITAISIFVIIPSINKESIKEVILLGALFGLVTYATYDLTNYVTLNGFPLKIVIIDIIWGTFLSTLTATITYFIYRGLFL